MHKRFFAFSSLLLLLAGLVALLSAGGAAASDPPSTTAAPPAVGETATFTWKGTITPGADPASDCNATVLGDTHDIKLNLPAGFYDTASLELQVQIAWGDAGDDEILTLNGSDGSELGSSDGSGASEIVTVSDPKGGTLQAIACPFLATGSEDYTGTLRLTTKSRSGDASIPPADAQGLSFTAAVPADNQRDEAEPLMEIGPDGKIYTCGPTGFSNASDYAQVSTDGGDQFHLLGTPPRGQQGGGGGGDCGLGTAVKKNADGAYQYAYAGLGPLTGFTTSTSPDNGRTIFNAGPQGNTNTTQGGGADRQWLTFLDDKNVLLSYNQQQPRNIVVQKSTDGGYSYLPGNDTIAAGNPDFPGPMRTMPARIVDPGAPADARVAYFGWNTSDATNSYVMFAISDPTGLSWSNCVVQKIPLSDTGGLGAFTVADNDTDGNVYLTYSDQKAFHTYLTTLTHDKLGACTGQPGTDPATLPNPGWSAPVQVDRGDVRTTVFPWLVAEGQPGRVAVAFYGTETDGDPNPGTFKASWNVYVNQSLNALAHDATLSQVRATTHPFHYDSVCLNGLGCDLAVPPGDRSLADFFAIDVDPVTKKLFVVFDQSSKKPDESTGHVATPLVFGQNGGPSNLGGDITPDPAREPVRSATDDPAGDALVGYSALNPTPPTPSRTADPKNEPAMDFLSETLGDEVNPATGAKVANGGFTLTLKLKDLSDGALQQAMQDTASGSLLWVFRFANGFQAGAASARYDAANGFTFGYNDYTTGSAQCGSDSEKCVLYPGDKAIKGKVDQKAGTIVLSVPRSYLRALAGSTAAGQRPTETKAVPGSRFYDAAAFSLGNASPDPSTHNFLYPADNTRAMDFLLPGAAAPPPGQLGGEGLPAPTPIVARDTSGSGGKSHCPRRGFLTLRARGRGHGVHVVFGRLVGGKARFDFVRVSQGRAIKSVHVATFRRAKSFTWSGRGRKVRNGYYVLRARIPADAPIETRFFAFRRAHRHFRTTWRFAKAASCGLVSRYSLGGPVFGGRHNAPARLSYRVRRPLKSLTVVVLRGKKKLRSFKVKAKREPQKTYHLSVRSRGLRHGLYRFRIQAVDGAGRKVTLTLRARRL